MLVVLAAGGGETDHLAAPAPQWWGWQQWGQ